MVQQRAGETSRDHPPSLTDSVEMELSSTVSVGPSVPALITTTNYYGRIPVRQSAPVGSYGDPLVVTVLY